jgi:hypothetical protein
MVIKMKVKILLFIICILFLTSGCTINYTLTIDADNNYNENVILAQEGNEKATSNYYMAEFKSEYPILNNEEFLYYAPTKKLDGVTYYKKSIYHNSKGYEANYRAQFNIDNYKDSRMVLTGFETADIGYDSAKKQYYIECDELTIMGYNKDVSKVEVKIVLDDKYVAIDSNATTVSDNTYKWTFKSNKAKLNFYYQDKDTYEKNKNNENNSNNNSNKNNSKKENNSKNKYFWAIGLGAIAIYIVVIVLFKKIKRY